MVSKNNQWQHLQASAQRVPHYGLRKLSVGVASVLLSTTLYMGVSAHADTVTTSSETVTPAAAVPASGSAGTETTGDAAGFSASGLSASLANSNSEATSSQAVPGNSGVTPEKPAGSAADAKAGSETPANNEATNPSSTADRSANPTETPTSTVASDATLKTTLNTTFKWTIHYNDETGNQLRPDSVITHDYTRTDIGDQMGNWSYVPDSVKVTGTPNTGWHIDSPDFKFDQTAGGTSFDYATWQAAAAAVDGYTPKYGSVALTDQLPKNPESLHGTSTVDGGPHEFTFEYVKQPTKVTINYVDDEQGETIVSTGTVSGQSGTAVTITPSLPKGYMLTPDKDVPGSYTVTDADHQVVTIHVQKQFVDLSDTDPQAKQTRTVTLNYVYGAGDKQGQPAFDDAVLDVYYHRTATLDRATNQTTYGDWMWDQSQGDPTTPGYHVVSGKWTNLPQSWANVTADVPSIKGYYADLGQNDPANTNYVPANTWVFPTYNNAGGDGHTIAGHGATAYLDGYGYEVGPTHTIKYMPNQTTVTVNYVDDDNGKAVVGSQHWDGATGQHIDLTLTPPENYVLTPGWVNPSSYDFDGVNSSWFTVHVKHATQDVTDQQPKDQVTKVTRLTRNHLYGDGPHKGEKFAEPDIFDLAWKRTATKDLVTDKVTFGDWQVDWDDSKSMQGRLSTRPSLLGVDGDLYSGKNGYSYKGDNAHSEFVRADGSVKVDGWNKYGWRGTEMESYPVLNYYYGPGQVNIPVVYIDADTGQKVAEKINDDALTGNDFRDGNTVTIDQTKLTSLPTTLTDYQLLPGQTLPTSYKIDTFAGVKGVKVQVVKDRSVKVTFVDDYAGGAIVGTPITITGHTGGDSVALNLTVPDKYELADGQQLPTSYTFTKGSGDLTIHLAHQIVQRDATIDVQLGLLPIVLIRHNDGLVVATQTQWTQSKDEIKSHTSAFTTVPFVKVGTLLGHVSYDLVNNAVVSVGNDWTTLNLGGRTYQLPNGTDVVNGILIDGEYSLGKPLKETYLTSHPDADSDYITRPWHGYLSVNATNNYRNPGTGFIFGLGLQAGLVGNESNVLAKAIGDHAATAVEMTNKTIDLSFLNHFDNVSDDDFSEQNGRLQAKKYLPVVGVYVPYVEKTATRTIEVTTPDGKITTIKQTATLAKEIDFQDDAHPAWTTGEWANYNAPTIPGYTPSQSQVAPVTVDGDTTDQTVKITYTANKQSTTVVYQDQNGTSMHITTVNGQTGQTVKVPNEVPTGWQIVNGEVPSEITFGPDGAPKTVVTIDHSHVTVTPDQPRTNGTKLPDNPAKTFTGVEASDLNKTITRTIKVTTPDGQAKTVTQTAKLTRTADVDEVTGEVKYSDWSTGQWDAYEVPALKGYTPSQNKVDEVTVTSNTKDQTVNVTYNANQQTLTIRFVDEDLDNNAPDDYLVVGHVLTELDRTITGKTGESFDLNIAIPDHYVFDSTTPFGKKIPKVVAFTPEHGPEVDGDVPFYSFIQNNLVLIPLRHQQIDISDQHPETKFTSTLTVRQILFNDHDDVYTDRDNLFRSPSIGPDYAITTFWRHQLVKDAVTGMVKDMGIVADTTKGDTKTPGMTLIGDWQYTPNTISTPKLKFKVLPGLALTRDSYKTSPTIWAPNDNHGGIQATKAYRIVNNTDGVAEITDFGSFDANSQSFLGQYKPQEGQNAVAYILYRALSQKATIHIIDDDFAEHKTDHDLSIDYSWNNMLPETAFSEHQKDSTLSNLVFLGYRDLVYDRSKISIDKSKLPVYVTTDGDYYIQPDEANEYTVHVRHKHSKVSADQSISDFTESKYDNLLNGLFGDGDDLSLRYEGLDKSDLNKVVTRTITVISPIDGTKQTINQVANLTRSADVDEATTEVKYDPWTTAKWETYRVPTINGYTPTQSQIIETTVTDSTKDQTVEVTYTANPQTTYVNYVDDSGKVVHTTGLNGKTGQTLKVPVEVPVGWTITKGQVPSEITFGVDGHEPVVITIGHHHVTVDPADPKTPIDLLPDNSTKNYPSGVSENDLNKMVTRTIKVVKVDGITTKEVQTVKLTRNADVDEVTDEVKYGAWTTGQWDAYEVPAVPGYTASQTSVAVTPVDGNTKDQMIDVSYTANSQTTYVNYVDDAGKIVHTTTITGKTGETVKVPSEVPAGWKLVDGQTVPNEITFGANGHEPVTVKIEHQVKSTQEQKTITRTINYVDAKGAQLKPATVQMLSFARTGMQDLVTNAITWNSTPAQSFAAVNDLAILGYKPDITTVPAVTVNWDDQDSVVDVHYQVANSTVTINLVDAQGHVIATTPVTGQVGSTVDLVVQVPDGWVAYNADIPARVVIGSRPTELDYLIAHRLAFVRSTDGVKAGDLIPGTKTKTFNDQVNADNLVTHASYTVNVWADEAHTRKLVTKTYATDFIRNAVVDAVTGEVYYYSWSEGGKHVFAGFTRPAGDGYQAVVVPAWTATQADPTKTVDLVAQPQQTSGTIQYQTADGTVVSRQTFMGNNAVTLTAPEGYILMTDDAAVMPTLDKNQTYVVYVRPVQTLYTATDKLPEGMESLSKTLTRTIRITEANGHVRTITQWVRFTRTATVKADGSIVYSAWRATGRAAWNKVFLPKRHGYHVVIDGDFAKMNVTADMSDLTVNVKYVKD